MVYILQTYYSNIFAPFSREEEKISCFEELVGSNKPNQIFKLLREGSFSNSDLQTEIAPQLRIRDLQFAVRRPCRSQTTAFEFRTPSRRHRSNFLKRTIR